MPRIPPEELERLKQEVSIQRLAESRGIKFRHQGKDLIGLCPFHEDKNPSLVLTPEKNLWNCLGACGTGGTVIDWVMKTENVSFRHAVEILREGKVPVSSPGKVIKGGHVRGKLVTPISFNAEERELMTQVVTYYQETLKKTPAGLAYLEKRGLKNSEMIEYFKIGYSDRTLGLRLPESSNKAGAEIRTRLQKIGIYRDTGREHFCGALVFPIFDENGTATEIYGRKTTPRLTKGLAYHLYLPGPHKGVFNLKALRASNDIILCESIIDALTFWCAGFRNVTASYGVNGFTPDILEAFKKYEIERVYIAYDRDQAGDIAAKKLSEKLIAEGFECFRILFPRNMDANEYAQKTKPASKALDLVFRNATWLGKGKREPKTATKGEKNSEAQPNQEAAPEAPEQEGVTPFGARDPELFPPSSNQQSDIFPLEAKEPTEKPPELESGGGHPARSAPVSESLLPKTEIRDAEIIISIEDRRWRIRGLGKNMSYDQLKVNILVSRGETFFVDTFDLYSARSRVGFLKQAAAEFRIKEDILKADLGKVLLKLEELQDKQIRETLEPKEKTVTLTPAEQKEALALLQDPNILNRILEDFRKCGLVGEETNKLVGYLSAVSRKLDLPLGIIIQSSSAAGKTALMESILAFVPEEEKVKYSAMTGQSLFYMSETNLKHKILAIVEEEGAERASYAIKLLLTEGVLTIASTGKDPTSGRLVTHEYKVEGPVMVFVTTTNIEIDPELQNRCIMLSVDESREQTRAIHRLQRERRTLAGLIAKKQKSKILKVHQNAQRLLKPAYVVNHFAPELTFLDDQTRTRRDNEKYLSLIETITLIHQYQRPFKTGYEDGKPYRFLEVLPEDIELANQLTHEVLGHSLNELPPQSRRFLMLLEEMVTAACERLKIERSEYRFYRRDLLDNIGWTYDQIRVHLERLVELEYVLVHRGYQGQRFMYELLYDGKGKDGKPFCVGLIAVENMKSEATISTLGGKNLNFGGPLGAVWGGVGRGLGGRATPEGESVAGQKTEICEKNAYIGLPPQTPSYPNFNHMLTSLAANQGKANGIGLRGVM